MSTDSASGSDRPEPERTITLTLAADGEWWAARDEETGVASQGETREQALENLDEALAGFHGEGHPPSDEELREIGVDPENNESGSIEDSEIFE